MQASTLLERMLQWDKRPKSLAFAVPLLRGIAGASTGTEDTLIGIGLLAQTLLQSGGITEAESLLRELLLRTHYPRRLPPSVKRRWRTFQIAPSRWPTSRCPEIGRREIRLHGESWTRAMDATER